MKIPFGFDRKSGKKDRMKQSFEGWEGDEAEYYEDEYYAEEEYSEGEYTEEEYADGEYYAEEEYIEDEYTEEEYEQEYSEEYAEEDYSEEFQEEAEEYPTEEMTGIFSTAELAGLFESGEVDEIQYEETYDGNVYGEDDGYEEIVYDSYEEEEEKAGFFMMFQDSGIADKLLLFGGILVLLLALAVGFLFIGTRVLQQKEDDVLNIGGQMAHIQTIGGSGLLAVSDAQKAALEAAQIMEDELKEEEESSEEYEEEEYEIEVDVNLSMSSIEKDLKIKFINEETKKLVGNVPFSVTIKDPNGKTYLWSDDDMDGIIYKKNLAAGNYKVTVNPFENEKYNKFGIPGGEHKVQVKEKIDYNKVDVSNEVKSESQVDVQKEDTKKNETVVEGYLADTVPWVESTATLVSYTEVAKSNIPEPITQEKSEGPIKVTAEAKVTETESAAEGISLFAMAFSVMPKDLESPAPSETAETVTSPVPTTTAEATTAPTTTPETSTSPSPEPTPEASTSPSPEPTPEASTSPSPEPTPEASTSPSPEPTPEASTSPSPEPTPAPSPMVVTLDKSVSTVYVDFPVDITVAIENVTKNVDLTAVSSDANIVTATVKDNKITLTGIAAGKANVTVNCAAEVKQTETTGETTIEKTISYKIEPVVLAIEVKSNPAKDTKTPLLDKEENEVYVQVGEDYREAVLADYYTYSKFYLKGEAKYTGWQTIEGKRYFFDASGKAVTGEQVIQGVKYIFTSDGILTTSTAIMGIDVSKWNGSIDWTAVKNSGVSYVIIRCGYRGSTEGALIKDSKFETNIQGAINAGLKVGVYFFTQALDKNEALEEASMVLDCVKKYKITYPIFLDVEPSGGRADGLDVATRTEVCKTFCETIQKYGYTAGIYANKNWLTEKINTSELGAYKIWLAQYASAPTYTGRYDIWQYKSTGKVSGISGDVDLNLSYLGY